MKPFVYEPPPPRVAASKPAPPTLERATDATPEPTEGAPLDLTNYALHRYKSEPHQNELRSRVRRYCGLTKIEAKQLDALYKQFKNDPNRPA